MEEERLFNIAFVSNRKSVDCENKQLSWEDFKELFKETKRTSETVEEYKKMTKEEKVKAKDVGGFICGYVEGVRKKENVLNRNMITLDMDHEPFNIWDTITFMFDYKCLIYSTHTHMPDSPRLRLIIPLDRDVTIDEYEAISRRVAKEIDDSMNVFDNTTYEFSRIMFLPSTPRDGEYIFEYQDGDLLKADEVLNKYTSDWRNPDNWPRSKSETAKRIKKSGEKVQDPRTKTGYIGAFCRSYTIHEAIETFLSDVYERGSKEDRYKYIKGESADGLQVFDEVLAHSYQDSDKISGKGNVNAFDLVRLNLFGDLDSEEDLLNLETKDLKSFKKMCEFVCNYDKAKAELTIEEFEKVDKSETNYKKRNTRDIEFLPLAESLHKDPIREYKFLVNRLLYDNAINLISGDPKTYKTYVAIDIALGVITGESTIDHKVLKKGKVLMISTEFDVRQRFIDLLQGRGIKDISILNNVITFMYDSSVDTFQWNKDLKALENVLEKEKPKLLILDPLSYIFDGDINKGDEVGEFFKELKALVRKYDLSVLIIHHNNRMSETKRMNNVSGSSAITRFVDSIIYLERFKEDEEQDINKTDEELDKEVKSIKLIKGQYRYGRIGYKYYTINFKTNKNKDVSAISAERLVLETNSQGIKNIKSKTTIERLEDKIIQALEEEKLNNGKFTFKDVLTIVNNDNDYSDSYFEKLIRNTLNGLVDDKKWLEKDGHSYKYLKVF